MRGFWRKHQRKLWLGLRNLSAVGALVMFGLAIVAAQTDVDLTRLPLGDGRVSTEPLAGYVWSCQTSFPTDNVGAYAVGDWFNGDGTFDFTAKAIVDGAVQWDGQLEITVVGEDRIFTGNRVPVYHTTGTYPISSADDAYQFDRNPNTIQELDLAFVLPANPTVADQPSCLPMGTIGVMQSGVVFFNALDAGARDAVAYETQDACQGHPEQSGEYHYHNLSTCVAEHEEGEEMTEHSALMGYALDGFGIYGHHGEGGIVVTNEDLDECHGHTHIIEWDGVMVEMYHYHATYEYPYTLGCFRGTPADNGMTMGAGQGQMGGQTPPQGGTGGQPPQGGNGGQQPPPGGNGNPPPPGGGGRGNPPPPGGGG